MMKWIMDYGLRKLVVEQPSEDAGTAYDMLSTLTASEISITGATTATISRMHVCSGTSADYTVTLPAVSGNTGKLIGFRMSSVVLTLVDEVNLLRQRLAAQDAVVAAATSLANLKSDWATMASARPVPDRTPAQAKNAIASKLNSGGAD